MGATANGNAPITMAAGYAANAHMAGKTMERQDAKVCVDRRNIGGINFSLSFGQLCEACAVRHPSLFV